MKTRNFPSSHARMPKATSVPIGKPKPRVNRVLAKPLHIPNTGEARRSGDGISIVLPLPPSTNDLWEPVPYYDRRRGKWCARLIESRASKSYKESARLIALAQLAQLQQYGPLKGALSVSIRYYMGRGDSDNRVKVLWDSLNGVLWEDDRQIAHHEVWRHRDLKNPRVLLSVRNLEEE
jgi:Holliday junction resolvase RusA-like endonuclease